MGIKDLQVGEYVMARIERYKLKGRDVNDNEEDN